MQVIFLFLESLGTPEMILIALVALIVFGPRKLPQIGRTIGKYTAEFKRASREFRDTLEREVQMAELEEKQATATPTTGAETSNDFGAVENTIGRSSSTKRTITENENNQIEKDSFALPEVRAMSQNDFTAQSTSNWDDALEPAGEEAENTAAPLRKREWL